MGIQKKPKKVKKKKKIPLQFPEIPHDEYKRILAISKKVPIRDPCYAVSHHMNFLRVDPRLIYTEFMARIRGHERSETDIGSRVAKEMYISFQVVPKRNSRITPEGRPWRDVPQGCILSHCARTIQIKNGLVISSYPMSPGSILNFVQNHNLKTLQWRVLKQSKGEDPIGLITEYQYNENILKQSMKK